MKKPNKPRKRAKAKTPVQKRKGSASSALDMFRTMDEDTIALLQQALQQGMEANAEWFDSKDAVDVFKDFVELCKEADGDENDRNEVLTELGAKLADLQISVNGGNPDAREEMQEIGHLLEDAIADDVFTPIDLMLLGKIFADAGSPAPDSVKEAISKALQALPPATGAGSEGDFLTALAETADQIGNSPFEVHEHLNSLTAALPTEASVRFISALIAGGKASVNEAVVGFVLHSDADVARSAAEALAAAAARTPVPSTLVERLVRIRPWLPQARQAPLDAAIRAMRLNALPPVKIDPQITMKCYATVCDGSGARSLFVTQRSIAGYQVVNVMVKIGGVADAMVLGELTKPEMDGIVRDMKSSVPSIETDLAGVVKMLGLAIADNIASGKPPPFKLIETIENLGLATIPPDPASPAEIIAGLLSNLPAEQTNLDASAKAHTQMLGNEFADQWFEVGEALEELLYPIRGAKQRTAKLLKDYLPERRQFWARQCAISALAMHGDLKKRHTLWKTLALVGRDIASDMPLDQIPLMKRIAKVSVEVFESQM